MSTDDHRKSSDPRRRPETSTSNPISGSQDYRKRNYDVIKNEDVHVDAHPTVAPLIADRRKYANALFTARNEVVQWKRAEVNASTKEDRLRVEQVLLSRRHARSEAEHALSDYDKKIEIAREDVRAAQRNDTDERSKRAKSHHDGEDEAAFLERLMGRASTRETEDQLVARLLTKIGSKAKQGGALHASISSFSSEPLSSMTASLRETTTSLVNGNAIPPSSHPTGASSHHSTVMKKDSSITSTARQSKDRHVLANKAVHWNYEDRDKKPAKVAEYRAPEQMNKVEEKPQTWQEKHLHDSAEARPCPICGFEGHEFYNCKNWKQTDGRNIYMRKDRSGRWIHPTGGQVCFDYNLGKCSLTSLGKCSRAVGKHVCTRCGQNHPAYNCTYWY